MAQINLERKRRSAVPWLLALLALALLLWYLFSRQTVAGPEPQPAADTAAATRVEQPSASDAASGVPSDSFADSITDSVAEGAAPRPRGRDTARP